MYMKQWTLFFVLLLSTNHIISSAYNIERTRRASKCKLNDHVEDMFNSSFQHARENMNDTVQLSHGQLANLKNLKSPIILGCSCLDDRVRIYIQANFMDITSTWLMTVLESLLGGLLGPMGSMLNKLLGSVVHLLMEILAIQINVLMAVDQMFNGGPCLVYSYKMTRVTSIHVLHIGLPGLVDRLLDPILQPLLNTLLTEVMVNQMRDVITKELEKNTITPSMHNCPV